MPQTPTEPRAAAVRVPGAGGRGLVKPGRPAAAVAVAPAAVYLMVRAVGGGLLALLAHANGARLPDLLGAWDGHWFLGIAQGGYGGVPLGLADAEGVRTAVTPLAFFPGYPAVVAALRFLTGLPTLAAAVLATLLAGVVTAYGLARLMRSVPGGSPEAGLLLVALFAAAPMSVVLSMAYSEALFCACAVWTLVGVLERRWLLAGLGCVGAGLVRPTAAALVVVVAGAAVVSLHRRDSGARPWAALALAPLGLLGYRGYVALRTGSPTGWFDLQASGWRSEFDGGAATARFVVSSLATGRSVLEIGTVVVLAGAVALLALAVRDAAAGALPWPLVGYGAAVLLMALGSDGVMSSKARLLVPAFALLVPLAVGLARVAGRRRGLAAGAVAGLMLVPLWFGAYAVAIWPSAF